MTAKPAPASWFPRRGEVCIVRMDKPRPALVISTNAINRSALDVCVIPITSVEHPRFALRVPLPPGEGGLARLSWAKCDQVTTLGKSLVQFPPLGQLSSFTLSKIEGGIKLALGLS